MSFALAATVLLIPAFTAASRDRLQFEFSAVEPQVPTQLIIAPALLAKLRTLAAGLHAEVALCLSGTVDGDTAHLTDFFMPEPTLSTPNKSLVRPCPDETLAVWHNHPLVGSNGTPSFRGATRYRASRAAHHLCVLSETDIQTSVRFQHPFVIVGVDRDTWCWWSRDEVERLADLGVAPGLPAPEKLVGGPGRAGRAVAAASSGSTVSQLGAPESEPGQ